MYYEETATPLPAERRTNRTVLLKNIAVVALAGLLFGYDTGVISGSQLYFTEYFSLTPAQQGWAVSSALFGCLFGAMASGYLTRKYSRKYTLIFSAFLFVLSAWGSGVADTLDTLVYFRILGGLGVGMASMAAPMYIAEISPAKYRGQMVSYYQLAIVLGFFVVFLATYYIGGGNAAELAPAQIAEIHKHNVQQGWRLMLWSELLPALTFLVLLFFVPHSPRWLLLEGRKDEAHRVLLRINANPEVAQQELDTISRSLATKLNHTQGITWSRKLIGLILVGVSLSICQQVTGINAILYYGAEIFSNALGYGPEDALKQQLWLGAVNLIFTFVAIHTVDRWGRKPLLLVGTLGMLIGLVILGGTIFIQKMGVSSLLAILLFIGCFALSMGPVVWVMLSEMFPNRIRSLAMSIAVAAQWLFNGLVTIFFPMIASSSLNQSVFNGALPYVIFAFFCAVTLVLVWKLIPETKGRTLEELEYLVGDDSAA